MAIKFNHTGAGDIVLSSDAAATLRVDGNKVWHENNDGTGSLLDADLLDGAEGSAYAKLASNETVTGNWTVSGNWGFTMDTIGDFMFWRNGTTGAAGIGFRNDDGVKGYIGFDDAETFNIYNAATSSKLTVDNAGNLIADGDITGLTVASITAANLLDKSATESVSGAWTFTNTSPTAFEKGIRPNNAATITSDADLIIPVGSQGVVRTYVSTTGATNLPTAAGVWLQVDRVVAGSGSANGAFRLFQASSATPDLRYAVWNDTGATWVWDTVALASDLSGYLPLTGGALTGALSSTGIFTSTAVASLAAPNFLASNSGPAFGWYETDAAVDEKAWDIAVSAGQLRLRLINDALNVATNIMTVDRTGTTIDNVTFAPAVYFSGGAAGTPSLAFSSEPTTGIYRSAAGAIAVSVLGTNELTINQTKAIFAGAVDVGGNVLPTTTGTYAVGSAANRWSYGYAGAWYATDTADTVYMNHTGLYSDRASTYFRNTNASGINYYEADTAHYFRDYNAGAATNQFVITSAQITAYTHLRPDTTNVHALGGASAQWSAIYGTTLYENGTSLATKYAQLGVAGAAELAAAVMDFDASTDPGWYRLSNTGSTNGPGTSIYYYVQNIGYVGGTTLHNRLQIAWPYRVGTDGFYLRSRYNDVWTGWKQVAYLDAVLNLTGGTVTGDIIRSGVGSNSDPGADNLRIGGYGIMGNRSALYITNANASGEVRIGNNGVHAVNNLATFSTSGLSISAGLTMVGTIDGLLGQSITDFGSTSVNLQKEIGFFSAGFQATGYPAGANYWSGIEFKHNIGTDYRTQIATGTTDGAFAVRYNINGTWGSWHDVWQSGLNNLPRANNSFTLGSDAFRFSGVYATAFYEAGTALSAKYTGIDTTMLGKTGNVSYDAVTDTAAEWGALPVGYSRMMANTIGIAGGAPLDSNYGYFTKVANRDSSGGWAGMWVGYSVGQNYLGRAATNAVFATWEKLWSDANDGASSGLDADLLDGQEGSYYAPLAGPAFTGAAAISHTGSHLSLYETDAVDTLDRALMEVNSNALNLYGYDNSAATWRKFFAGNITSGAVEISDPSYGTTVLGTLAVNAKTTLVASGTSAASLNIPHGAAPTSPTNGDVWTTTAGMYARINGSTVGPFGAGAGTVTSVSAGNGMNFTTITGAGSVTLGTPGSSTSTSTNAVTANSHTHAIDSTIARIASPTFTGTVTAPIIVATTSVSGVTLGVAQTAGNNGYGLSLYNGPVAGTPTYGIMFQGTGTYGTHGAVTGDWATYFTMNNTSGRGWIFRDVSSPSNVASISNAGVATFSGTATANGYELGWRRVVQITGAGRTLVVGDAGKSIHSSSTITVNSGIFTAGDVITITNSTSAAITISQGTSVTLYLAGTATTGSRTLAGYGIANIVCVASNTFYVSGAGVT